MMLSWFRRRLGSDSLACLQHPAEVETGKTDLSEKIKNNLEKNIATAFEYARKLISAKDIQDVVRTQTEFMQTQLQTLNEQAKDLGETATKAITDRFKGVSS